MTTDISDPVWDSSSYDEKNKLLFEWQKKMLEEFLERNAISKKQYDKSLHKLKFGRRAPSYPYPTLLTG